MNYELEIMINFNYETTHFSKENAYFLAQLSALAYENEADITDALTTYFPAEFSRFRFIDTHQDHKQAGFDAQAFVIANQKAIFVVFRGTEDDSLEDIVSNMDNRLVPCTFGHIYQGFYDTSQVILADILKVVQDFQDNNQLIYLTGHSQGGALAMLMARLLGQQMPQLNGVYTFGQPKIGDMLFSADFDMIFPTGVFRLVNVGDNVVNNPPSLYHAGICVQLDENGNIEILGNTLLESSSSDFSSVLDMLFDVATDAMQSHEITEYIKRLSFSITN